METKNAKVHKKVSFQCPCGGEGSAGDGETDIPAVFHSVPHCQPFAELEPDAYLRYVRTGSTTCKQIQVYESMDPKSYSVGWLRDDMPVVHVFAQTSPGQPFQPSNGRGGPHWPCDVCEGHGYTELDFQDQMLEIMQSGPKTTVKGA